MAQSCWVRRAPAAECRSPASPARFPSLCRQQNPIPYDSNRAAWHSAQTCLSLEKGTIHTMVCGEHMKEPPRATEPGTTMMSVRLCSSSQIQLKSLPPPTGTIHRIAQPCINKPSECFCLFLSFSDILGICGNLSCLYNKATAQCLWHHIHGNPNIACTGK